MSKTLASLRAEPYKLPRGSRQVRLTCGHSAWYVAPLPVVGEPAYCRTCDTWTTRTK
jgi:hypothetical protein